MANNVSITQGAGTSFGTDDVAGVHIPLVKIVHGEEDSATRTSAADPFPVTATGSVALTAGETHIGEVGGNSIAITPAITVTAGAYSAADVVGGRQTLTDAMRVTSGTGVLQDIILTTKDGELLEGYILLFDTTTASSIADNAAFVWGSGDQAKLLAFVTVVSANWTVLDGDGVCHKQNLGIVVQANGAKHLYAYFVTTGTPTFGTTSDLGIRYKFQRD
jgi:hypothetical protein